MATGRRSPVRCVAKFTRGKKTRTSTSVGGNIQAKLPFVTQLTLHYRDPELFPFQCGECFTRVKTEEKLKNHHKYKSKVCFRFQCESCDTKFSSTKSYYTHNRTVHEVELGGLEEEEVFVVIVPNNADENINVQLEEATVGVQEM